MGKKREGGRRRWRERGGEGGDGERGGDGKREGEGGDGQRAGEGNSLSWGPSVAFRGTPFSIRAYRNWQQLFLGNQLVILALFSPGGLSDLELLHHNNAIVSVREQKETQNNITSDKNRFQVKLKL